MRVLIVDDEPLARLRLRALLQALPELDAQVLAEAGDADEAMAALREHEADGGFDVVLLDIRMPGLVPNSGLRLAATLRALPAPPAVVFVTAHAEHALKAFELEATDYLTKPVRSDRLLAALLRVRSRLAPPERNAEGTRAEALPLEGPTLVVSDRGRLLRLPLAEVLVLRAEAKYVTLRTPHREHLLDESLTELESRLAALGGRFIRIHRSAIVARHAVRALELRPTDLASAEAGDGWAVQVEPGGEWLAVSRRQLPAVRAALLEPPA